MTYLNPNRKLVLVICNPSEQDAYVEQLKARSSGDVSTMVQDGRTARIDTAKEAFIFVPPILNRIQGYTPDRVVVGPSITDPEILQEARIRVLARNGEYGTEI